jgi:Integrase core domain
MLAEAKLILAEWLEGYNSSHPHSSLEMLPPARSAGHTNHRLSLRVDRGMGSGQSADEMSPRDRSPL